MTSAPPLTFANAIDWRFAATVGQRLARPGPLCTEYTRRQAIDELRAAAQRAVAPVGEVTGLIAASAAPPAQVVDRPTWIRAAADSMQAMMSGSDQPRGSLTGRITGAQLGAVLAFIASGILGQYDPFGAAEAGNLLLVYPNVLAVERQLRVEPADFRLWVCLHEVTHWMQFTANPWLAGYMSQALAVLTQETADDFGQLTRRLVEFVRTGGGSGFLGLVRAVQSEPQRQALDQLMVLGTLLEGHAEHVMDAVGPMAVPSVGIIRRRFDERRQRKQPPLRRLLRALLGFDAKLSQYTRGKAFVDEVVNQVGMQRFNAIWSNPETLPLSVEIEKPRRWIDRVL